MANTTNFTKLAAALGVSEIEMQQAIRKAKGNHEPLRDRINAIKDMGYEVHVEHVRQPNIVHHGRMGMHNYGFSATGGLTTVTLKRDDQIVLVGEAVCSKKDNYNKRVGLEIALGRVEKALAQMEVQGVAKLGGLAESEKENKLEKMVH